MSNEKASDAAGWKFDNSYAQLPDSFFSFVEPTPVRDPEVVIFNENLAQSLGLDNERLKSEEGIAALSGNRIPEGARPLAQAYAGHQFGHFTMLGDGRAILLGEHIAPSGERFDIQLKGAGLTPYSRQGDGRAALGPMLREYIVSEAMHALGIPTTRGLAVVKTGETIFRETRLPGAILTRVASSHIRVGTFEFAARWGTVEQLRALADYTLRRHFPKAFDEENRYLALLGEVIEKQAELIAKWQLVGFVHGVMNTDNMAVSGETIDYGPCAFMDVYNPQTVFSSIDVHGRYSYGNQPLMAEWNLSRFAEALLPLLHSDRQKAIERAQEAIDRFADRYRFYWLSGMRAKLGLFNAEEEDESLIEEWLDIMEKRHLDFIRSFRLLSIDKEEEIGLGETPEFSKWLDRWKRRRSRQEPSEREAKRLMRDNNPAIIARNHLVEEALEAAVERNDYSVARRLLNALQNPFDDDPKYEQYMSAPRENRPYVTYCGT